MSIVIIEDVYQGRSERRIFLNCLIACIFPLDYTFMQEVRIDG